MGFLSPVSQGQKWRPTHGEVNAMYAAARQTGRVPTARLAELSALAGVPFVSVLVENGTGSTVEQLGVAVLDGSAFDPDTKLDRFQDEWRPKTKSPTADGVGRPVVFLERCPAGEQRDAVLLGLAVVQVDIQDASHTVCGPKGGDLAKLVSGVGSVEILDRESGTGVKWCLVLLGGGGGTTTTISGETHSHSYLLIVEGAAKAVWDSGAYFLSTSKGKAIKFKDFNFSNGRFYLNYDGDNVELIHSESFDLPDDDTAPYLYDLPAGIQPEDQVLLFLYGWKPLADNLPSTSAFTEKHRYETSGADGPFVSLRVDEVPASVPASYTIVSPDPDGTPGTYKASISFWRNVKEIGDSALVVGNDTGPSLSTQKKNATVIRAAIALDADGSESFTSTGEGSGLHDADGDVTNAIDFFATQEVVASAGAEPGETWTHDNPGGLLAFVGVVLETSDTVTFYNLSQSDIIPSSGKALVSQMRFQDGVFWLENHDCIVNEVDYTPPGT